MGCRFPRTRDLSGFWAQLFAGGNAVIEGPPGSVIGRTGSAFPRFHSGNDAVRFGAFVEDLELFDAEFFRISPVEARTLDPQQRMMLEVSWRALEDAAIDPLRLRGTRTGVYAGISLTDYREIAADAPETTEAAGGLYAVTGNALNTAVGRVSYVLGLEGPALAIDTACSSSLVAIHQAVGGLQRNEADLVLAGGVHVHLAGRPLELRANAGMLSPTGQCWTFDASADGFVSGEGCGLIVLKRLSDAEADGDRIWAVIPGSSVNQDGASQGLTVPSGPAQARAIEDALEHAGIAPSEVDYLEAHGTGTVVGDPIEMNAAAAAYGRGRAPERPLLVGSVKTNIGHLGPAAGVAGLIKTVLAMRHGVVPRHLNFTDPNPRIDWDRLPVRVTDVMMDWPIQSDRPRLAGVNAFGWSGTNGHVLVQGYEEPGAVARTGRVNFPAGPALPVAAHGEPGRGDGLRETRFLPLSARSPDALSDSARGYLSWLDEHAERLPPSLTASAADLSDMAWTAGVGRSHFPHRAGLVFSDLAQLRRALEELARGEGRDDRAAAGAETGNVAFVFTGQASQWPGMGKSLYEREPVFRAVLDRCDRMLLEERGASLLAVMFGQEGTGGLLDEAAWTQPAVCALECALVALWESVGIRPGVVLGHSLGEIAAAHAAGGLTLDESLRYAAARGALMGRTRSDGSMAAVFAPASRVAAAVAAQNAASADEDLAVAVDNGPQQVVSGPAADLEAVLARFEDEGVKVARLRRSPAYHSALIEPALDDLEDTFREIAPAPPALSVPLVSDITGRLLEADARMDSAYWRRHAREPVAFRACVETLAEMGVDTVVEIGPHAVLGPVVSMTWPAAAPGGVPSLVASLQRPPRDAAAPLVDTSGGFVEALAAAYEAGLDFDFAGLFTGETRRRVTLPGHPFRRTRHWVRTSKRHGRADGHALLGSRHESARGELVFETELLPTDPAWLPDHLVFGRVVVPGSLYGAMAISVGLNEGSRPAVVDELQIHGPLMFDEEGAEDGAHDASRAVQFVVDASADPSGRGFEIFSRGTSEPGWTLHAAGRLGSGGAGLVPDPFLDPDAVKARLLPREPAEHYRMRSTTGIYLGPAYHTLETAWAGEGEALATLALHESVDAKGMEFHPLLLDGCFQVLSMARHLSVAEQGAVYMPFGWERLWVAGPMPERLLCHATLRTRAVQEGSDGVAAAPPEVVTGDVRFYTTDGAPLGGLLGFTVKRATRNALLSPRANLKNLMYEVAWREKALSAHLHDARFLASPAAVASRSRSLADHLADEGVEARDRAALLADLERLSRAYALSALERLGWQRNQGDVLSPADLHRQLAVGEAHRRLFDRLLGMLSEAGILSRSDRGLVIALGAGDPLPDGFPADPESLAEGLRAIHPHGAAELGLLSRCGAALAEVLQGRTDALMLLFGDEGPRAAEVYLRAPASRAANALLGEAVAAAVSGLPEDRLLRVLEVGAGTGSATEAILPHLPAGRFEYTFTDISAGFFSPAEERLAGTGAEIRYQPLDIETEPVTQGVDAHAYDLVIAANVLHATRDLGGTLAHCRNLLAPSGQLMALEGLRRRSWQDLTFGLLDGWWRFADRYRPDHALAAPAAWRRALDDTGFAETEFLGTQNPDTEEPLGSSVILAREPADAAPKPGAWIIAADGAGAAMDLAGELADRGQTVVLARADGGSLGTPPGVSGVTTVGLEPADRASWRSLLERLPGDPPLRGVVHLMGMDGHGASAATGEMAADVTQATSTALALAQGIMDAQANPTDGVWFVTRGAQVLEQDLLARVSGELAGAAVWGFGKVLSAEAPHLRPRLIDLDPAPAGAPASGLALELLFPDSETHIAYRGGVRQAARLIRVGAGARRIALPEEPEWVIGSEDTDAGLTTLRAAARPRATLKPGEVRVTVEAAGLNFVDALASIGAIRSTREIGRELVGRVVEAAGDVEGLGIGDQVVGLGFGSFTPETVTRALLVAPACAGFAPAALATMPVAFVTAELAFRAARLEAGERVLIHAGAGGVGLAAIQLAQRAGAEIFATASAAKRSYLRSLGVAHVFDSRNTRFADDILQATGGDGVHVVLNSLTGEGFIEASISCLSPGGRFVEIGKRGIWSTTRMAASRPDVAYCILDVDGLKRNDPARVGASLSRVMDRLAAAKLSPLPHTVWPLSEIPAAADAMRDGRHIGKNVLRMPPLVGARLRPNRTYLVTGGLGGIGCVLARWLADRGAGAIVLNGRRDPDPAADRVIRELREGGAEVRVEIGDVTDSATVDDILGRIGAGPAPLGGVFHSVGVLSDGVIENQTWDRFERVLWPKVLGAWHLHQATRAQELDLFVLFSSVTGVIGNPGQSNHAAANAFLDQLAAHRRGLGLPGQAIAWGAWSGIGEAEEQRERIERQLAYTGAGWITPQQGIEALDRLVKQDVTMSAVTAIDWSFIAEELEARPPFLDELLVKAKTPRRKIADAKASDGLLRRVRDAPAEEKRNLLAAFLRQELQAVLHLPAAPSMTAGFFDLGMDSLMAVELRNRLNRAFAGEYAASNTVVFDHPSVTELARHLAEEIEALSGAPRVREQPAVRLRPQTHEEYEGIAIVGIACRFPRAPDLSTYWEQLLAGADLVTDGRPDFDPWRNLAGERFAGFPAHRRGGYVAELERFDARFFNIRPIEARVMDPQQRMLLETGWHALEDAGIAPDALRGSCAGVFAGMNVSEYRDLSIESNGESGYYGTMASMGVGRVAFALGLTGPAIPFELTCASSLAAVHGATAALRRGETDLAIVGGVSAILSPSYTKALIALGMLSPDGRCSTFDASASGFVRGEGCGVVVLKRLGEAEAAGDRIWGVIRGSAVRQSGTAAGLTIPSGPAQEQAIADALAQAGIEPSEVDYLEAHGTGSAMGDPIEMHAAGAVYGRDRKADRPLLVGTVKTNMGHLEAAAGIAGLIKVVLAMRHGVIPKQLHFETPNPQVNWHRLPVRIVSEPTDWPLGQARPPRAGVSAFGVSGANAHVVVEGYETPNGVPAGRRVPVAVSLPEAIPGAPPPADVPLARDTRFLPLSAKSGAALGELARDYLAWLDERGDESSSPDGDRLLADLAWTAGVGRSHFDFRAAVVFGNVEALKDGLASLAEPHGARGTETAPETPRKTLFAYSGEAGPWVGATEGLYEREPVFRAVVDRCGEVFREERGASLLELMFGGDPSPPPECSGPALYAVQCGLTALWSSVGIRPQATTGDGAGKLAAAQAAGTLGLEEGLLLAATGGAMQRAGGADPELSGGSEIVMEIGPEAPGDFAAAVAKAYEAGLEINFEGLFAGETRRRISLPGYPFERRRYWIPEPRSPVSKSG